MGVTLEVGRTLEWLLPQYAIQRLRVTVERFGRPEQIGVRGWGRDKLGLAPLPTPLLEKEKRREETGHASGVLEDQVECLSPIARQGEAVYPIDLWGASGPPLPQTSAMAPNRHCNPPPPLPEVPLQSSIPTGPHSSSQWPGGRNHSPLLGISRIQNEKKQTGFSTPLTVVEHCSRTSFGYTFLNPQ